MNSIKTFAQVARTTHKAEQACRSVCLLCLKSAMWMWMGLYNRIITRGKGLLLGGYYVVEMVVNT
jgi:hypothetical protein